MSYSLTSNLNSAVKKSLWNRLRESTLSFGEYMTGERSKLILVLVAIVVNAAATVITPWLISLGIDNYIAKGDLNGLNTIISTMVIIYAITVLAGYVQSRVMGRLSQRTLFRLRNRLFNHIQNLPIAFFNQNKSGDLISRLNNDTDKINQFLSESLLRSVSSFFSMVGTGVFIFFLDWRMAIVTLLATVIVYVSTSMLSPWVQRVNKDSLASTGDLSAEVQESLTNFKAIVAFNRQQYFKQKFAQINQENFRTNVLAQISSGVFNPIYNFAGNIAQIFVLGFGVYLISQNQLSIGLLIAFIAYAQKFYEPLRILGSVWGTLQSALAAWVRVREILGLESNLKVIRG